MQGIAMLARRTMNFGEDTMRSLQWGRSNKWSDINQELSDVVSSTELALNSINATQENLAKAQAKYAEALAKGSSEEQESNRQIIVGLQKLIDLNSNFNSDLLEAAKNGRIQHKKDIDSVAEYSKQVASIYEEHLRNQTIDLSNLFEHIIKGLSDQSLDGKRKYDLVSGFIEQLKEDTILAQSTHLKQIEHILSEKTVHAYDVNQLKTLLTEVFAESKHLQTANEVIATLDTGTLDLSDTETHEKLTTVSELLSRITSLSEEQRILQNKIVNGFDGSEREQTQIRSLLRRVTDQTTETKTLHVLNNIEDKFDKNLLKSDQLKSIWESLGTKITTIPRFMEGKSGSFLSGLAHTILGALGLAGLTTVIGSAISGIKAGASVLTKTFSIGWSVIKGVIGFGGMLLSIGKGLIGFTKILADWALIKPVKLITDLVGKAMSGVSLPIGKSKVTPPTTVNNQKIKGTPAGVPDKVKPGTPTKPGAISSTVPHHEVPKKTSLELPTNKGKIGSVKPPPVKAVKGGGWRTTAAATAFALGGAYVYDKVQDWLSDDKETTADLNINAKLQELEALRNQRTEVMQGQELTAETYALTDLTNSINLLNEAVLRNSQAIANLTTNLEKGGFGSSIIDTAGDVALTAGALGATAFGAMKLKNAGILGGTQAKAVIKPGVGISPTADLAKSVAGTGVMPIAKSAKDLPKVSKATNMLKGASRAAGSLLNVGMGVYDFATAESNAERIHAVTDNVGGAGGAWAGAAAGAAIGSIIPGVGTAIGGLIGGIVGGIAGSSVGSIFGEWFSDPLDEIPDSVKEQGPLAEYMFLQQMLELSKQDTNHSLDEDDQKKIADYQKNLLSPGSLGAYFKTLFESQSIDYKSLSPEQMQAEIGGVFAQLNESAASAETPYTGVPNIDSLSQQVTSALLPRNTSRQISKQEMDARKAAGQTIDYGYSGIVDTDATNRALYGAYDTTKNRIYYNTAVATQGQSAIESMRKHNVDEATIKLAEQQLANQNGMSLKELNAIHGDSSYLDYQTADGATLKMANGKLKETAVDADIVAPPKQITPDEVTSQDIDTLKKTADKATAQSTDTQNKALASKVVDWVANTLPQTIVPLIGMSPNIQVQAGTPIDQFSGSTSMMSSPLNMATQIGATGFTTQSNFGTGTSVLSTGVLSEVMARHETKGDYNLANQGVGHKYRAVKRDFSNMTVAEVMQQQSLDKNDPNKLFAVGKYQIIPETLKQAVAQGVIKPTDKFDQTTQDKAYVYLTQQRSAVKNFITGKSNDINSANDELGKVWASVQKSNGQGHYDKDGVNKARTSTQDVQSALAKSREVYQQAIAAGSSEQEAYEMATTGRKLSGVPANVNMAPNGVQGAPTLSSVNNQMGSSVTNIAAMVANTATGMSNVSIKGSGQSVNTYDPVGTGMITSLFGPRANGSLNGGSSNHKGLDFRAGLGTPVKPPLGGTVTRAETGNEKGYGNWIEIDHGNGLTTRYAHLSSVDVQVGQQVQAGQVIGQTGNTGGVGTGPHLHYETRINGNPVDPTKVDYARYAKSGEVVASPEYDAPNIGVTTADQLATQLEGNTESTNPMGSLLNSIGDSISNNPLGQLAKKFMPQVDYIDANGNKVRGSALDAVMGWSKTAMSKIESSDFMPSVAKPNNTEVLAQVLNSPQKALDKQSQLIGQAQGSSVAAAQNTGQSVILAGQQQRANAVGLGVPKPQIDDPMLLIAQAQTFGG